MKLILKTPKTLGRILLCSTDEATATKLSNELTSAGYDTTIANSTKAMITLTGTQNFDTVVLAASGDDFIQTARKLRFEKPDQVLILLGADSETSSDTLQLFYDVISSPAEPGAIITRVGQAVRYGRMQTELRQLRQQVAMSYGFDNIIGESDAIRKIKETAARVAPTDIAIMMMGASGTGRNLMAKTIFHHSTRRKQKLVTIDCATIPESMMDSELFGAADTTQGRSGNGLLSQADGGTVIIDNVQMLSASAQLKMLHLFKFNELSSSAGTTARQVDIRFLTIATVELLGMVSNGAFNEELFNQMSVIRLDLPTLLSHREDIGQLCDYFLRTIANEQNCAMPQIDRTALELLMSYRWPGNVRELESSLKRAFALCKDGIIAVHDIILLSKSNSTEQIALRAAPATGEQKTGLLADSQKELITKALSENDWNFTRTAEALGIGRTTLWRKVKKYDLHQYADTVNS